MKRYTTFFSPGKTLFKTVFLIALLAFVFIPSIVNSQTENAKEEKEEVELISPSLEFVTVQKGDNSVDLKSTLQAKVNKANKKLPHLRVTYFLLNGDEEIKLGHSISNVVGKGVFNCKGELITADKEGNIHLKAVFAGNNAMEAIEEELTIRKARLEVAPLLGDTVLTLNVKLTDLSTGSVTPVPEAALGIFVRRHFNPLKVAESTTDENGEGSAVVPFDLPGDQDGNIVLLVRLDEHELYGNVEAQVVQTWGTTVSNKIKKLPRALWSQNPPIWMLVTFIILVTIVWGHYIVIIYELFRLRKEEPQQPA